MYDEQCYELAEHFLSDEPELDTEDNRRALAEVLQKTVEDFFEGAWTALGKTGGAEDE